MAHKITDRVRETSATIGTGAYALAGAVTGYQQASAIMANGDTAWFVAKLSTDWEVFKGTWNTGNTLSRTQVYKSTNANNAVNWAAGAKDISLILPGFSDLDAAGLALVLTALGISSFVQTILDDADGAAVLATMGYGIAAQSDQEAGSDATKLVTSARQHFHPSAAKAWVKTDAAATNQASYNIASLTDSGTGFFSLTLTTGFSSANAVCVATPKFASNSNRFACVNSFNATSASISALTAGGVFSDPDNYYAAFFGDL